MKTDLSNIIRIAKDTSMKKIVSKDHEWKESHERKKRMANGIEKRKTYKYYPRDIVFVKLGIALSTWHIQLRI